MSVCVATRYRLILETRHRNEVARNSRQSHLNKRKRKNGVLTRLNHQPARLISPDPTPVVCQLETPLISNSVLKVIDGKNAATINTASGRIRSLKRVVLTITSSKEERSFSATNPDLRN